MCEKNQSPDLELWKDQQLFKKQHRLKLQFWEIFSLIAENVSEDSLSKIYSNHKSKKLSRGNDLLGMPYHVLDIIRNFDPISGLNIRILNWFGHGMFVIILSGKTQFEKISSLLHQYNYYFGTTESPWDYPGLILENQKIKSQTPKYLDHGNLQVWIKEIPLSGNQEEIIKEILKEVNLIISQFSEIINSKEG